MSLNHRERHQLYRIESRLFRSDPQLAAMLAVFAKLSAGQRLPSWEQVATRPDRIRQAAARIPVAITGMAAAVVFLASVVGAFFATIVVGGGARRQQPARLRTRPGTDGRADPAGWS